MLVKFTQSVLFKELSSTSNALGEVFSHVICFLVLPSQAQDCQYLLGMGDPHSLEGQGLYLSLFQVPELNVRMGSHSDLPNHTYPVLPPFLEKEITLVQMQKRIFEIHGRKRGVGPYSLETSSSLLLGLYHLFAWLYCLRSWLKEGEMRVVTLKHKLEDGETASQHFHCRMITILCLLLVEHLQFWSCQGLFQQNNILRISFGGQNKKSGIRSHKHEYDSGEAPSKAIGRELYQ